MAKALLGIATDTNVPEGVRLAAVKDALDRGGIQAKTAVSVEVSAKPFELVFDAITAGPRYEPLPEIEGGDILDEGSDSSVSENGNDEIVGEIDDDEIEDYPSGFIPEQDSGYTDVVDVR